MKNQLLSLPKDKSSYLKKLLPITAFAFFFGLVKLNSVSALFISSNLSPSIEVFGMIDYALAVGLILAVLTNAGLPGAFPYFILKMKKTDYESVFFFHGLMIGFIYGIIQAICFALNIEFSESYQLVFIVTGIFSLQILAAVMCKSKGNIFKALIFEAGFFIILNIYNLYLFQTNNLLNLSELKSCYLIYLGILLSYYLYRIIKTGQLDINKYKEVLRFGFPLITSSLLIICLTGSARIIIERWIGMESVGIYGIYFRLAALVVIFHQIINIAFFKKIYTSNPKKLDQWFSLFLCSITIINIFSYLFIPHLVMPYVNIIGETWDVYKDLYITLCFQMIFWINLALFENIIYRENLSGKCNKGLLSIFVMMILALSFFYKIDYLNLINLVLLNTLAIYMSCEWKIFLLRKEGMLFPKTQRFIRFLMVILLFFFTNLNIQT